MDIKHVTKALNKYVIYTDQYGDEAAYILRAYRCFKNKHGILQHCAELESLKANSRVTVDLKAIRFADSDTIMGIVRG